MPSDEPDEHSDSEQSDQNEPSVPPGLLVGPKKRDLNIWKRFLPPPHGSRR